MSDQHNIPYEETERKAKQKFRQEEILAKEDARTKSYLAREIEIKKVQDAKQNQRLEARAKEETRELIKEKARKEAYDAREKAILEAQEAKRLKTK
jgi:hypothetical protein